MTRDDAAESITTVEIAAKNTAAARQEILLEFGAALAAQANLDQQSAWLLLR